MSDEKKLKSIYELIVTEDDSETGDGQVITRVNSNSQDDIISIFEALTYAMSRMFEKTGVSKDPQAMSLILSEIEGFEEMVREIYIEPFEELSGLLKQISGMGEDKEDREDIDTDIGNPFRGMN